MSGKFGRFAPGYWHDGLLYRVVREGESVRFLAVIERGAEGFGAYVLDLPGCVAAGESKDEVLALIREAVELHVEAMLEYGEELPEPSSSGAFVEVGAA